MNAIAVNGARIVPPIMAPIPRLAQTPASPPGSQGANRAPSAPPMIISGASTPPDVPEPSAIDQITALVINNPSRNIPIKRALSRSRITS